MASSGLRSHIEEPGWQNTQTSFQKTDAVELGSAKRNGNPWLLDDVCHTQELAHWRNPGLRNCGPAKSEKEHFTGY
jgi:hypothetical protein